ncbi:MAG TPA: hypothetical protein VK452_06495 [Dissulfurispiraceae bacterium]|nr:hypothetical protein [Dissulfurispiraceae bacterium]
MLDSPLVVIDIRNNSNYEAVLTVDVGRVYTLMGRQDRIEQPKVLDTGG